MVLYVYCVLYSGNNISASQWAFRPFTLVSYPVKWANGAVHLSKELLFPFQMKERLYGIEVAKDALIGEYPFLLVITVFVGNLTRCLCQEGFHDK